jgi:hypothetical protein
MDLRGCESEEHEDGVGAGPNTTLLSDTLLVVNRSRRICYRKDLGLVAKKTHGPVWMRERGA